MPDKPKPAGEQTPFERFTEAAKQIFTLPKKEVRKVKKKRKPDKPR
jgi:hypothetical protein